MFKDAEPAQPSAEDCTSDDAGGAAAKVDAAKVEAAKKEKRQKRKTRSVWISFYSRIVAQFVGSAATIVLGLLFLHKYHTLDRDPSDRGEQRPAIAQNAQARERSNSRRLAVAVLPLDNYSGDARQDALADALTDALTMALSQMDGLSVVSRTSAVHYKRGGKPLPEIARELSVDWIVEGSLVAGNGRVRIVGQLIDASNDEHVWAAAYDRQLKNPLLLQTSLAEKIARDLDTAIARRRDQTAGSGGDRSVQEDSLKQVGTRLAPRAVELSRAIPQP
jgi:TolB-like protein